MRNEAGFSELSKQGLDKGIALNRNRRLLWLLLFLFMLLSIYPFFSARIDDAYISYRFARNLAENHCLSFNIHGAPVEGYSNFLWTLIHVPAPLLFRDPIYYSKILGLVLLVLNFYLVAVIISLFNPGDSDSTKTDKAIITNLLICASPGFFYWHLTGMEVPLLTTFLLLGVITLITISKWAPLPWIGLLLTRIDTPLIVGMVFLVMLLYASKARNRLLLKHVLITALWIGAVYCLYYAWRIYYYGDLFPNTYYAKLSNTRHRFKLGFDYVVTIFKYHPLLAIVPFALWKVRFGEAYKRTVVWLMAGLLLTQLGYLIYIGGDWMPLYRFFAPFVPLLAVIITVGFLSNHTRKTSVEYAPEPEMTPSIKISGMTVTIVSIVFFVGQATYLSGNDPGLVARHTENTLSGKEMGSALKLIGDNHRVMATAAAGAAPYFSELYTIDTHGLSDRHIARVNLPDYFSYPVIGHEKGDGEYVLEKKPDLLIFVLGRSGALGYCVTDAQIKYSPKFYAHYKLKAIMISRKERRYWFFRLSSKLLTQLLYLGDMEVVASNFGIFLRGNPNTEYYYYERLQNSEPRQPVQKVFLKIEQAVRSRDWKLAMTLLSSHRPEIESASLEEVIEPLLGRYSLLDGDLIAAKDHINKALAKKKDCPLLELYLHSDPIFESFFKK